MRSARPKFYRLQVISLAAALSLFSPSAHAGPVVAALFSGFSASSGGDLGGMDVLDTRLNDVFGNLGADQFTSQVFSHLEPGNARDFIENSGNENVVLIGHSLGGETARELAESLGDTTVSRLVLIDSVDFEIGTPTVPDNVGQAFNFYQISTGSLEPQGAMNIQGATNINAETYFDDSTITHTTIYNDLRVQDLIVEEVREILQEPGFSSFSTATVNDPNVLASALVSFDTGIYLNPSSADFLGNESPGSASFHKELTVGGADFQIGDGILLTSGVGTSPLQNTESSFSGLASQQGEASLDTLLKATFGEEAQQTTDTTALSFSFHANPGIDAVALDFIYATEEYPDQGVIDIAGIFVDGVNRAGFADGNPLSFVYGSPSTTNFSNNNQNHENGSSPLAIEYDGVSRRLTLVAPLDTAKTTHTIKLAISDTADSIYDSGLFAANLRGVTLGGGGTGTGTTPSNPLLPPPDDNPTGGFDFVVKVGDTGFGIDPTQPIFIDSIVAVGYIYESFGPAFAGVLLPDNVGDNIYSLSIFDGAEFNFTDDIVGGILFDFLALDPLGISKFKIEGIEASAALDPASPTAFITGLTFVSSGNNFGVKMTPITSSVPEPSSIMVLAVGLFIALRLRHRNTRNFGRLEIRVL